MTPRDIFLNTLNFQPVSRLPRVEWAAWWDKTIARWENEGLPRDCPSRIRFGISGWMLCSA